MQRGPGPDVRGRSRRRARNIGGEAWSGYGPVHEFATGLGREEQMILRLWQVDAFAERPFGGNPAAVVPLEHWLDDSMLQAIANENNLAETAFLVRREAGLYDLRWFTPSVEVPLCGHATLASSWVIFAELAPSLPMVRFATQSGMLTVEKSADGRHSMALPAGKVESLPAPPGFGRALGDALRVGPPSELHFAPTGAGGTPAPIR